MNYIALVLAFIMVISFSSAYEVAILAQKQNIALNYGEKRIMRVLIDPNNEAYAYTIKINGKNQHSNLRVYLVDKNKQPITNNVLYSTQGKDVVLYLQGKNKRAKEIYLIMDYYTPSSINQKLKVEVELKPIASQPQGEITSIIAPAIYYSFNVYLNAYLPLQGSQPPQQTSQTQPASLPTTTPDTQTPSNEMNENATQQTYQANTSSEKSGQSQKEENVEVSNKYKVENKTNLKERYENDTSSLPTGEVIAANPSYISTAALIIIGLVILFVLWRKL